ncbi:hypothetical protein SAMN05660199_02690 [Klenkia soli]|uniref:VOC domain-containing protein n=1 Tax=Klenkia soli TaxID=1052260 RepID=A0A1H0N027_9ACTN|nr:VOC family protein [Klenkia soli]SDO85885.1 hypothetical protein SAMN05660199_02690 [Klenkia soli]
MPTRSTPWPAGTPCWVDLATTDLPAARTFYAEVFGWTVPEGPPETGGYSSATLDGHRVAGLGPTMQEGQPTAWLTYVATDDVAASVDAVRAAGGTVHMGPDQVGPLGSLAVAADPTGVVFGLWQAGSHPGVELFNEHGGLVWNEAVVGDPAAARKFYTAVFGWAWDPVEGMETYQTFRLGDRWLGGLGAGPDSPVQGWGVCFAVRDTDATVADVTARGGTVLIPAQDSPYGRYAVVADPQGAAFSLMQTTGEAA